MLAGALTLSMLLLTLAPTTRPAGDFDIAGASLRLPDAVVDAATGVRWHRDVAYVEGEGAHARKHLLDLYLPAEENRRAGRPVVVWIHGGGWTMGDKDDAFGLYGAYCRKLAENGVAAANASYRLSPAVRHPAHVQDVAAATAWVIRHADQLGYDADAVFVSGHSAGGHLAALLASDPRWLAEQGVAADAIAGAIPSSGVFDLAPLVESSPRWQRAFAAEDAAGASPVTHVDAKDPPFVFIVESNGAFMRRQTRRMASAVEEAGVEQEVVEVPGVNHITMLADLLAPDGAHLTTTLKFIDRVLARRATPRAES